MIPVFCVNLARHKRSYVRSAQVLLLSTLVLLAAVPHVTAQNSLPQLSAPENLCLSGAALSWQAVERADGYRVRWRVPGEPWHLTDVLPAETSYVLQDLPEGAELEFQVQALATEEAARHSFWSSSLLATPGQPDSPTSTTAVTPSASESEVESAEFGLREILLSAA